MKGKGRGRCWGSNCPDGAKESSWVMPFRPLGVKATLLGEAPPLPISLG